MLTMRKPRIKPEHTVFRLADGRIRVGGLSYGIAAEIADPPEWVWALLQAMDGSLTMDELVARVVSTHPDCTAGEVEGAVWQLTESGHVDDAGAALPNVLSRRDFERYDRPMRLYRWMDLQPRASWEPQERLRGARVTVVGLGGAGGAAAAALVASGVGMLHCVDSDVVELSNLSRQLLYCEDDLGTAKVVAGLRRLRSMNSDVVVTGEQRRMNSIDDLGELAAVCDVLVVAADEPSELRMWSNRACLAARRPWVSIGYHGPLVQVDCYVPGAGGCFECLRPEPDDVADRLDRPVQAQAAGAVSAGLAGLLGAHRVIAMITGVPPATPGRIDSVNLLALDSPAKLDRPLLSDCPACGTPA